MLCPTDEVLAAWIAGVLDASDLEEVQAHAADCAACRSFAVAMAGVRPHSEPSGFGAEGAVIGRYRVTGSVGEGGMGVVLRGHDPVLDREVAIKMLRDVDATAQKRERTVRERRSPASILSIARDSKLGREVAVDRLDSTTVSHHAIARFLREARIQARLEHPSIVPVHELGTDADGTPYFTMKRLAGVTLAERLTEPAPETRTLLNAFVAACAAIELAHARGVVHRDLKPENIMLGDYREVYVLDWGVARVLDEADPIAATEPENESAQTQTGTLIGTPRYMAPEQARGEPVGPPADVFALGAILFEILAHKPLRARDLTVAGSSAARRSPDREIAPELDAVCCEALADAASDRPSVHELGKRVQHYLDGDRDLEARRALAAEQLATAREALANDDRVTAMRAAGRALGLDPDSDAALLIGSLIVEPPRQLPPEVTQGLARLDAVVMRRQARLGAFSVAAFFLTLPFFLFMHVESWPLVLAMFAMDLLSVGVMAHAARQEWPNPRFHILAQVVAIAVMARLFSPFLVVPATAALMMAAWSSFPPRLDHPVVPLLLGFLGPAAALALELGGIVSRTWHLHGHSLELTSAAFDMNSPAFVAVLIMVLFASIVAAGLFTRGLALERRAAIRQLELQAWHLRKLVER
jgi:serine/threonine-protein kinase